MIWIIWCLQLYIFELIFKYFGSENLSLYQNTISCLCIWTCLSIILVILILNLWWDLIIMIISLRKWGFFFFFKVREWEIWIINLELKKVYLYEEKKTHYTKSLKNIDHFKKYIYIYIDQTHLKNFQNNKMTHL